MIKLLQSALIAGCLAVIIPALHSSSAFAQQATPPSDSPSTDTVRKLPAAAQTLETVRVDAKSAKSRYSPAWSRTGTRTSALVRDVPQAITTVTSALVQDQAMKSMAEVVRYMPGITMGQGEGNRDQPTIRGNATTADFFLDGVRDDAQYFRDVYNIERVEALKGANAMIFGRGGGGGVINRVTKEARWNTRRELSAQAGSFGARRLTSDLEQSVSNIFAARLNSVLENSSSFRDGVTLDRSGVNPVISIATPSRKTMVSAGYEFFRDRRTADRGVPSFEGRPVESSPSTFFGSPDQSRSRTDVNTAAVTFSHDGGRAQLRSHIRISDYDKFYQNIFPGAVSADGASVSLSAYSHAIGRRNVFSQTDLSWTGHSGSISHELLAGTEIGRQHTDNYRETGYFGSATTALVPLVSPRYAAPLTFRQVASDADNSSVASTSSVYVQDQISLASRLRLIAGARYERFVLRFTDKRADAVRQRADEMISPRFGVVVKPAETASIYASYSVSFLPGSGDQFGSLTEATRALEPERFANYEAGAKWDLHDRLALSVAAYRLDRENTRAVNPADPTRLVQTGAQRSQGIELAASGEVIHGWETSAGFTRQRARIVRATAASPAGARVPIVPETSLSLWNRVSVSRRLAVALGAVHQSKMFAAIDNKVILPAFTRTDAALFAELGLGLRAQVNVENLFDVRYYPTAHSNNNISPGSPREARLTLSARF